MHVCACVYVIYMSRLVKSCLYYTGCQHTRLPASRVALDVEPSEESQNDIHRLARQHDSLDKRQIIHVSLQTSYVLASDAMPLGSKRMRGRKGGRERERKRTQ